MPSKAGLVNSVDQSRATAEMIITEFRNSAKAIIIEGGRLLTICRLDPIHGEWFLLPGGGQHPGENLHDALRREVREETGLEIEIGDLVFVREYIGVHHEFADEDSRFHQVEFIVRVPPRRRSRTRQRLQAG
jgi:ADP-ribose pyrophosphatase YjhB (NUDIX family)